MTVVSVTLLLLFLPNPKQPRRVSISPLQRQQAQIRNKINSSRRTPITMPAIAPELRPVLCCEAVMPVSELPSVATGAMNGTVVVAVPVIVVIELLVGRMNAESVDSTT